MTINQIYSLLNDINQQIWGEDQLAINDLSGVISMGTNVIGNAIGTDKFLNTLVDRIGKTIIRTLDLELEFPGLFMNEFEFGAVLAKINLNPFGAISNSEWEVGDVGFTPTFADVYKPTGISVKYFHKADTWKFRVTIPDDMLSTAFLSAEQMNNFITAIISAMTDSMTMSINNMSRTAIVNLIAEKFKLSSNNCINLLSEYLTLFPSATVDQTTAMTDKDFIRFATNYIRKYVKYLGTPSMLYNEDNIVRVTARDNMHILALTDFTSAVESYLESDTFHNEFVALPGYTEVAYWQANKGASTINDFATNSSIKVTPSSEEGQATPTDVEQGGIICVLADRQAVGVGINKRRSGSFYNSIDAYENISQSATIQYYNDLGENCVIFYVEDPTP